MAAYFHGGGGGGGGGGGIMQAVSADQGLQQHLCLPYSDINCPTTTTTRFFNHAPGPDHHHQHGAHLIGVPLPTHTITINPTSGASSTHQYYNLWGPALGAVDQTPGHSSPLVAGGGLGGAHGLELLPGGSNRRLTLSLSSQQQHQQQVVPCRSSNDTDPMEHDLQGKNNSSSVVSNVSNGAVLAGGAGMSSKYLRAAQELLDEIVRVGNNVQKIEGSKEQLAKKKESTGAAGNQLVGGGGSGENYGANKAGGELTAAHRQELQMKKTKLVTMIEEVEQRYRQYHHQMQTTVSSFEQAAGFGSAKSYTSLALQTISKQFRCLKDTISSQIKSISKTLGEDDCSGAKVESSRLKYVDHHLRHLGMIHNHQNAWRPQRGLPERAVSILRAWLFEHFLHPYPRDSDKHMLAKQTGLTRSQVSNWFINARVRLWKPMVEEMYLEEMKEQEGRASNLNTSVSKNDRNKEITESSSKSTNAPRQLKPGKSNLHRDNAALTECSSSIMSTNCVTGGSGSTNHQETGFSLVEMETFSPQKRPRSNDDNNNSNNNNGIQNSPSRSSIVSFDVEMKQQGEAGREINLANYGGGFGNYHTMGEMGRFYGNGTVSLSLGLPHCDNTNNISLEANGQHSFVPNQSINSIQFQTNQLNFSRVATTPTYQNMNVQSKKRFVAAPLLHDFSA